MTAILQTPRPAPTRAELAPDELAAQDAELLPDRETLCGWHCYPIYHCCQPVYCCAPRWCHG